MKINITSAGNIIEWGDITSGVAFNVAVDLTAIVDADNTAQVGSGSPEGAVDPRHAKDLYLRTSNGHVYYHAAASGNTGWVDATGASAPAGPTILSSLGINTASLVDGSLLEWDATNSRLRLRTPGAAIINATDATTVIAQLNALLAELRTMGVIAP